MDSQEFVDRIKLHVENVAVASTIANLKNPPGRRVDPEVRDLSGWYNGLSEADANRVNSVITKAVHSGLFGFFAVLDGSRTIDDERGRFELTHITDGAVLLNPQAVDLHDLFNAED
jgi:hypothetical protein